MNAKDSYVCEPQASCALRKATEGTRTPGPSTCTLRVRPNPSLKLRPYGTWRLPAPGACGILPSAGKHQVPSVPA
jgi:hypothetical protein